MSENNRAREQAIAQLESIKEMVEELEFADANADDDAIEEARQHIQEDALAVQVKAGWYTPGAKGLGPEEFYILLCTGGPAVRIIGDLDVNCQPHTARLQYQDWFEPWEDYYPTEKEEERLLEYCRQFYFGD